ncbi:twin-arginine translocase subunit TatC [Oceanicella sp. SM1341]|uniref:twin-arginine translocase subunit TatC n=1 Tax=Oceanicella sp. SM1341 TaxID=1548889 RepID=UPI000E4ED62E|nr:twin-arginine translocase subunit TatC [Oceanicella sp. SM1341]
MTEENLDDSRAPLIEHLIELRSRLINALIGLAIAVVFCAFFAREIFDFLTHPLRDELLARGQPAQLIYTQLYEKFFVHLKIALFGGVFLAFPVIAWQVWRFVAPGLYKNERGAFLPFLVATPVLFIAGASLVYFLIMPMAISFFLDFQSTGDGEGTQIEFLGKVNEYLSLVMTFILAFGICFQLPVLLTLMGRVGLTSSGGLKRMRKYAIVGIAAAAAVLTPPDPISQLGLALPIYLLYEISIWLVAGIERKEEQRLRAEGLWVDDEELEDEDDEEEARK